MYLRAKPSQRVLKYYFNKREEMMRQILRKISTETTQFHAVANYATTSNSSGKQPGIELSI
jgi:hypothetical protein